MLSAGRSLAANNPRVKAARGYWAPAPDAGEGIATEVNEAYVEGEVAFSFRCGVPQDPGDPSSTARDDRRREEAVVVPEVVPVAPPKDPCVGRGRL